MGSSSSIPENSENNYKITHLDNGGKYEGKMKELLFHGYGKKKYPNGDIYDGEWYEGKRQGNGVIFYSDEKKYNGEWLNDDYCGRGELYIPNVGTYEGEFLNGKYEGNGIMHYVDGSIFNGKWKNGSADGEGIMIKSDGNIQEGTWVNGYLSEQIVRLEHCVIYYNELYAENIILDGKIIFNNNMYKGKILNNLPHGEGMMNFNNGDKYIGKWKKGNYHDYGTIYYNDGIIYEGHWEDQQFNGSGKLKYPNKYCFQGIWKYGLKDGNFDIFYKDSIIFSGLYENDKCKSGSGKYYNHETNTIFIGKIINFKFEGHGELIINNHTMIGLFENGIFVDEIELKRREEERKREEDEKKRCEEESEILKKQIKLLEIREILLNGTYIGTRVNGKKHGIGTMKYNEKILKGIWKDGDLVLQFYDYDYSKNNKCSICYEEFDVFELFPICNHEDCSPIACQKCIESSCVKKGEYISEHKFNCMFCQRKINDHILDFRYLRLFNLIEKQLLFTMLRTKNKLVGWCNDCNHIRQIEKGECDIEESNSKFICDRCDVDVVMKPCPKCKSMTARRENDVDGCHQMHCTECKHFWCWWCQKEVKREHRWKCEHCEK
jgi:hypothetical protein